MSQGAAANQDPLKLFFADFTASARSTLADLERAHARLAVDAADPQAVYVLLRGFHALKGNSSFFEDAAITPLARAAEEAMERVQQMGTATSPELQVLVARTIRRLGELIELGDELGEPATAGAVEQELSALLDAQVPFDLQGRYLFWGQDVTEAVRVLAEAADRPVMSPARRAAVGAAVDALSRLAREADVHDVARSIEAVVGLPPVLRAAAAGSPETGSTSAGLDPAVIRAALRALSPLLERSTGAE
jgi:chemotaxis protein histidine kinase CheA